MSHIKHSCQVKYVDKLAIEDPNLLKIENYKKIVLRKLGYYLILKNVRANKNQKYLKTHENELNETKTSKDLKNIKNINLQAGDTVKIKSKAEILKTLDKNNRLKGCYFMNEMWQYCGTIQKVLKRVDYFYDECKSIMRKTHKIVLLDNLQCSGDLGYRNKCDRNCYFFWREEWLEKIE